MGVLTQRSGADERGFSLAEVMVALGILCMGLLALAGVFTIELSRMTTSSWDIVAKEQATQALESVFAARDAGRLKWTDLQNTSTGGIFAVGPKSLIDPGPDAINNTGDDDASKPLQVREPGPNGNLGDSDDKLVSLATYTREVKITPVAGSADTLREVRVIIEYTVSGLKRHFEVASYISSYAS
jgi:prepilin-type N-terminal cleavage/methylation domain-containing protein